MAISVNNAGGRRRGRGLPPMAEINVIPLVDVVLVLLIIFMMTAHVMEFGLEVEVPKVRQTRKTAEEHPVITISKDGEMQLNERPVNINDLGAEFRKRFPNEKSVYVRADKATVWDPIAQVISTLGEAKIDVRVVTQPDDGADGRQ